MWRHLRRINSEPDELIREAYEAANAGDWKQYVKTMGGVNVRRKDRPIQLHKIWEDKPGRYGEPLGYRVVGVTCGEKTTITLQYEWIISFKGTSPSMENEIHATE